MRDPVFRRNRLPEQEDAAQHFAELAERNSNAVLQVRVKFPDTPIPNKMAVLESLKSGFIKRHFQPRTLRVGKLISDIQLGKKGK